MLLGFNDKLKATAFEKYLKSDYEGIFGLPFLGFDSTICWKQLLKEQL
jgi:hypothetical protein